MVSGKISRGKKAQVSITFNWVYVLIAGAVILLFFVYLVVQQKSISEQKLGADVVQTLDSIFTGAGVAEKTKNIIDVSGLADYVLFFRCQNRLTEFGIEGTSARAQDPINPIFAPAQINAPKLITWSLPYKLPYKIIDFLFVTSSTTKYFVFGDLLFKDEFINATGGINSDYFTDIGDYGSLDPQKNFQVHIVDWNGILPQVQDNGPVPVLMQQMDDDRVTAVSFVNMGTAANFYRKKGYGPAAQWSQLNRFPVFLVSLGGTRDAAKYGAMFAGDDQSYLCGMEKAFQRVQYVTEVYQAKAKEITERYINTNPDSRCLIPLTTAPDRGLEVSLGTLSGRAISCVNSPGSCSELISPAEKVREDNEDLRLEDCITIY